jgi:hypothetical protein
MLQPGFGQVDAPGRTLPAVERSDQKPVPPAGKKLDLMSLPAGAILVVCEQAADALRQVPTHVLLAPEKYQEMLDEIARLKTRLAERPTSPARCSLKGRVEGRLVLLQAQFEFVTERPDALVALGGSPAQATAAVLDGRTPLLRTDTEGFAVQVEKPGEHQVTLDLVLALGRPRTDFGFEVALPRAAITTLELDLPPGTKEVRLGNQPLADTLLTFKNNHLSGSLGAIDKLDLSWKGASTQLATPILTAEGHVQVRAESTGLSTEAELTLRAQDGNVRQWRLLVPLKARVQVGPADEARVERIDTTDQKAASLRTIHLKEASDTPLIVLISTHAPLPRPGTLTPIGPFTVLGATRQYGSLLVSNAVADLHLEYQAHGDLTRRDLSPDDQRRAPGLVAAFDYRSLLPERPPSATAPAALSWLSLEAETVHGQVKTRLTHALSLDAEAPPAGPAEAKRAWRVLTTIEATPRRNEVDQLKVLIPPDCDLVEDSARGDRVTRVDYDKAARLVVFKLSQSASDPSLKPFFVTLEGRYTVEPAPLEGMAGGSGRAVFGLPRSQGAIDQGGQVTVRVPPDLELLGEPGNPALELVRQTTSEQMWRSARRSPERIEVAWQPYRPEVKALAIADVTLAGGQGHVRHEIHFQFSQPVPPQVALHTPAGLENFRVVEGGELARGEEAARRGVRLVHLGDPAGLSHVLVLEYDFAVEEGTRSQKSFAVPLAVPDRVTQGETRVRVWSEPGQLPSGPGGAWAERNIEEVKGKERLPALVLQAQRVDAPLSLRLGEPSPAFTVLVDRAFVRVTVTGAGDQEYRARFLVRQLAGRHLEVEMPAPVATLNPRVTLDRNRVDPETVDETGQPAEAGRIIRLRLSPELVQQPSVLEVTYRLPSGRSSHRVLQTILQPPVLRGEAGRVPVRWYLSAPSGWVVLGPEGGPGVERTWVWRGWLLSPRLALASPETPGGEEGEAEAPSLLCWRDGLEPLAFIHVPQQAWHLACSLSLLVLGFGFLTLMARPGAPLAGWFWPALALAALALVAVGLFWPTALAQVVYGCEPGAAVLVLVAGVQWLLHERYRRQIVFLPSFSRSRPGSSLLRGGSAPRAHGEPSTVDAPPVSGGSGEKERSGT